MPGHRSVRNRATCLGLVMQVRLELFNLLNTPNFAILYRVVFAAAAANEAPLPTAGRITRTLTSARQMQLGVKFLS
jgi:hypothetical protein